MVWPQRVERLERRVVGDVHEQRNDEHQRGDGHERQDDEREEQARRRRRRRRRVAVEDVEASPPSSASSANTAPPTNPASTHAEASRSDDFLSTIRFAGGEGGETRGEQRPVRPVFTAAPVLHSHGTGTWSRGCSVLYVTWVRRAHPTFPPDGKGMWGLLRAAEVGLDEIGASCIFACSSTRATPTDRAGSATIARSSSAHPALAKKSRDSACPSSPTSLGATAPHRPPKESHSPTRSFPPSLIVDRARARRRARRASCRRACYLYSP